MNKKRAIALVLISAYSMLSSTLYSRPESIEVVCQKSYFAPARLQFKKGEPVRLVLKSIDVTHGFAIDEFNIAREVPPGPPVIVEFTPDKSGEFSFYCVVRCGKNHLKMRGTVVVN